MTIDPDKYKKMRHADDDDDDDDDDRRNDDTRGALTGDDEMELDAILDSYSESGGYVFLRRMEMGDWTFLSKLEIPDAKLDQIQSRFGGGKYRVEIMNEGGRRLRQRTFRIAGKAKSDESDTTKSDLETRFERIEQLLLDRAEGPKSNGESVGMGEVLKVAMTALTARPTVDPLMQTLITALIGNKNTGDSVDPLELQKLLQTAEDRGYNRGKELGEAIAVAGGEGGDGVARALAANLPGVIDAFKSAKQSYDTHVVSRQVPKPATATATATPAPEIAPPTTEGEAMGLGWVNALRPAVPHLLKWAHDGKDAQIKAANTVDDLRDDIRDAIALQAESPDFVVSVISAIPEFQAPDVQPWVTVFLQTVQEMLTAPDDAEPGAEVVES
jgi:hypothetical protein